MKRYVIRDSEAGTAWMDSFDTIQECVDRIREDEYEDKKDGYYEEGSYEVYDNLKEEIVVYGFEFE